MYDRHGPPNDPKPENIYPPDLHAVLAAVQDVKGGIVIQLSTFSANNNNAQDEVLRSVNDIFTEGESEFSLTAQVVFDGNMMSLVYTRNVPWSAELADLPTRFKNWCL
jgi:hypothetical protein